MASRRPLLLRAARALAIALGVLLVIGVVISRKAAALVHARAVAEADRLGQRLGRAVTIGPARAALGLRMAIELDDVRIAAAPGQEGVAALPLFEVGTVRVEVGTWSIVRSLGKDVEVSAIEVRRPVVRLVRLPGGALSYADVTARLETPEPPRPARNVHVGRVAIHDAVVELHDLSRAPALRLAVEKIDAVAPEVRPGAPLDLVIDAAVLAPARNLHLELGLAPPADPPPLLGRLRRAVVKLAPVEIEPLVPFLPERGDLTLGGGKLAADLRLAVDPGGPLTLAGSVEGTALRLVHHAEGREEAFGPPVDAAVRADLDLDPVAPALTARSLAITAAGMTVEGHADVRGPVEAPEVRALALTARDVTFERLLALAPPTLLPPGVTLAGPIALHAEAQGAPRTAAIEVAVDLRDAALALPELHKPAGTPLAATLKAHAGEGGLAVDALGLTVGPLALTLKGRVTSATDVDLTADSGEVALDAVLRLFPAVARALPAGVTAAGVVQASGHVKRAGAETHAEAHVALRRADVKTSALELIGAADLSAKVHAGPGALTVTADLDAGGARALVPGRLDKAAGSPLALHAVVERAGAVTTVREAKLTLAGANVAGSGRYDAATRVLTVSAPTCDLHLGTLAHAVPALGGVPAAFAGARVHAAVAFEGPLHDLGAASLGLSELDLHAPLGHLRGRLDLGGLGPVHRVGFDLDGEALNLDALGEGGHASLGLGAVEAVEVKGKLHVGRLHARSLDARDVTAELTLARGVLELPTLRLEAFGGSLVGNGSRIDLGHGTWALRARAQRLDLAALQPGSETTGRLDADVSLDGTGSTWEAAAPALAGTVKLGVETAHVHTRHTIRGHVLNPILSKLAEEAKKKKPEREVDLRIDRATASLQVGSGKVATTAPLTVVTEDGTLTVTGAVGFDRTLALAGAVTIPPAVIEKATGGKRVPVGDVTVKVKISGKSDDPAIELVDLGATVASLLGSRANAIVKKIEKAVGK